MPINYSLSARKNPQKQDEPAKYYATAQSNGTIPFQEFCEHVASHGCVYSKGDVQAVTEKVINCLKEKLLEGYQVDLGDLGKFSVSLSSRGASEVETFLPNSNITKVRARWKPVGLISNLKAASLYLVAQFLLLTVCLV